MHSVALKVIYEINLKSGLISVAELYKSEHIRVSWYRGCNSLIACACVSLLNGTTTKMFQ